LASLRAPNPGPNAYEIARASSLALAENLSRHTAAYTFVKKDGGEDVASGTFVEAGGHLLLATVAHTVPRDLESIFFVKRVPLLAPDRLGGVTRRVASPDEKTDVAAFVLEPDTAARCGLTPIAIDRVHDGGTGNSAKAMLIGYPADYVAHVSPAPVTVRKFHALAYGCEPIEPSRWGAITKDRSVLDRGLHVVVEFDRDVVDWGQPPPMPGVPDPPGMSGGGLWQRPTPAGEGEIWSPDCVRLIGIQSSWLFKKGFLKAIQAIHWLRLVAGEFPELRDELETRFPRLRPKRRRRRRGRRGR
jgi:hypothetical protein